MTLLILPPITERQGVSLRSLVPCGKFTRLGCKVSARLQTDELQTMLLGHFESQATKACCRRLISLLR